MTRKGRIVRSRGIEPALPELERRLTTAAAARRKRSGRRIVGSRGTRIAVAGLACLAFGGSAMAATGVWDPPIGTKAPNTSPPTVSATPVPAAMSEALGAFRREPDARDRGPEVEATLSTLGSSFADGVRPDSVRYLEGNARGEATVLFSAERSVLTSGKGLELFGSGEPACVDVPAAGMETAPLCFGLDKILAGEATFAVERIDRQTGEAWGLVPDGVASVTARFGGGVAWEVPVADNYFKYSWGNPDTDPIDGEGPLVSRINPFKDLIWRDADGNVVPHQDPAG